jgi:class 3 adenylate cyclase/pimeloyl-ACP methyl ester carboxylesterase
VSVNLPKRRLATVLAADMAGYSRLMETDEIGILDRQRLHRREVIDPTIEKFHGKIVKTTGDGMLILFDTAQEAVQCGVEIQTEMAARESHVPIKERIRYRVGINIGDIIFDDSDIHGDGVNIAARLEALAEPGGICIADGVHQVSRNQVDAAFRDFGIQKVKNISRPIHVWRWSPASLVPDASESASPEGLEQKVKYCKSHDGSMIAYAAVGRGDFLVKAPHWLSHLEYEWRSPVWRHLMEELAGRHTFLRFDQRGNGLSDRSVDRISFDAFVEDLEAVVDHAGLERFDLLGVSQGCAISAAYVAKHPERVRRLVLYGGFTRGRRKRNSPEENAMADAFSTMIRIGWGQDNPAFRQLFTSAFMPDATPDQMEWFNELARVSASPDIAARISEANADVDVTALLPRVLCPTLVLHCREDGIVPFEEGRRLAAMIPDARFVALEGRNHLMLEGEPAWDQFLREVDHFLSE